MTESPGDGGADEIQIQEKPLKTTAICTASCLASWGDPRPNAAVRHHICQPLQPSNLCQTTHTHTEKVSLILKKGSVQSHQLSGAYGLTHMDHRRCARKPT